MTEDEKELEEKIKQYQYYEKEIDKRGIIKKFDQMIIKENKDEESDISFRGWSNEKSLYFWCSRCTVG